MGVDEVGRGCWAGPLVAGAVIVENSIPGLQDSKLLSKTKRQELAKIIQCQSRVGLGWVSPKQIDDIGLSAAVGLAMQQAVLQISGDYDEIIVDGNNNFLADDPKSRALIKADLTIEAVSAASIVAKVARDQYMYEIAKKHPKYGFERHVGYGTAYHQQAINNHGICEIHRRSYKPIALACAKMLP